MSKHKYIQTPELMWQYFQTYAHEVKSNPRIKTVFVGKDGEQKQEPLERPLTLEGFENWCEEQNIIGGLEHYFANTGGNYSDYLSVCSRIRRCIRQDQIEGGMVGQYNPSITQRLNNLVDKQEQKVHIEQPLFNDEL